MTTYKTNRKEYDYTPQESQEFRRRYAELANQIEELKRQREDVTGSDRAAVTRQITPLEQEAAAVYQLIQLCPPLPECKTAAFDRFRQYVIRRVDQLNAARRGMEEYIGMGTYYARSADYVIRQAEKIAAAEEWVAIYVHIAAQLWNIVTPHEDQPDNIGLIQFLTHHDNFQPGIWIDQINDHVEAYTRDLLHFRIPASSSTASNTLELLKREVRAQWVREEAPYMLIELEHILERHQVWLDL